MTKLEFALFIDSKFARIERHENRPEDKERSGVNWYPVDRRKESPAREGLEEGIYVISTESPKALPKVWVWSQTEIWLRMTDEEMASAQAAVEAMKQSNPKNYRLFADTDIIASDTPFYPSFRAVFVSLFGEVRTVEILETD